jgi:hypothetical protein
MDTRKETYAVDTGRGRKLGVMGGRPCASCGAVVNWRVEKFCIARPQRFGRRIYCLRCQTAMPPGD